MKPPSAACADLAAARTLIERCGNRFYNAADACCDFGNTGVDDVGYLRGLIEEIGRQFAVDRKRIHLIGHSEWRLVGLSDGLRVGESHRWPGQSERHDIPGPHPLVTRPSP